MTGSLFEPMLGAGPSSGFIGGAPSAPLPFDIQGNSVVRCGLTFGRWWLECDDQTVAALSASKPVGYICADISHAGDAEPELVVQWHASVPDQTLDATHLVLYRADEVNGVWVDCRFNAPVYAMD